MKNLIDNFIKRNTKNPKTDLSDIGNGSPVVFAALKHTWPVASPKDENDEDNDHNDEQEDIVSEFIRKHSRGGSK